MYIIDNKKGFNKKYIHIKNRISIYKQINKLSKSI